jgi:hypothetical protein
MAFQPVRKERLANLASQFGQEAYQTIQMPVGMGVAPDYGLIAAIDSLKESRPRIQILLAQIVTSIATTWLRHMSVLSVERCR